MFAAMARFEKKPNTFTKTNHNTARKHPYNPSKTTFSSNQANPNRSYANALNGNNSSSPATQTKTILKSISLNESDLIDTSDMKNAILAKVRDVNLILNIKNVLDKEGFCNFQCKYIRGLWLWIEFDSPEACTKLQTNKKMSWYFTSLKQINKSFVADERVIWIEIRGLPLNAWTTKSFKKIALSWGEPLFVDEDPSENNAIGRVCIKTKIQEFAGWVPDIKNLESPPSLHSDMENNNKHNLDFNDNDSYDEEEGEIPNDNTNHKDDNQGHYFIFGDFNVVRFTLERIGTVFNPSSANVFNNFIRDANLCDIPLGGHLFTRTNKHGDKLSKLDRFLISYCLSYILQNHSALVLDCHISDHRPILLSPSKLDFRPIPFKFFNSWLSDAKLNTIVIEFWDQYVPGDHHINPIVAFKNKMKDLKYAIKAWSSNRNSSQSREKEDIIKKIKDFDDKMATQSDPITEANLRSSWIDKLRDIVSKENQDIAQKAKIKWGIEADENTKFFHATINKKRSQEQSAFVKHHQILDGPLMVSEAIQWCKRKKSKLMVFKIDFEKAFDSISWDFLLQVMHYMGFKEKWIKWISGCLNSASSLILINGSPTREFNIQRGLRQGDPLSPFLFIIAMEGLHVAMEDAIAAGLYRGFAINQLNLSHLFFVDDALFIGDWSRANVTNLVSILECFYRVSGLKINYQKSNILGVGVPFEDFELLATITGCTAMTSPFCYLGLPIDCNMALVKNWDPIIDKFSLANRFTFASLLSIGGRSTLITSVLGAIAIRLPKKFPGQPRTQLWPQKIMVATMLLYKNGVGVSLTIPKLFGLALLFPFTGRQSSWLKALVRKLINALFLMAALKQGGIIVFCLKRLTFTSGEFFETAFQLGGILVRKGSIWIRFLVQFVNLDLYIWPDNMRISSSEKSILEAICGVFLWSLWNFHNEVIFGTSPPRRSTFFDKIVDCSYRWLPSFVLNGKSPYEMIYKKPPTLSHLRVFGCLCFATIVNNHDKFCSRYEKCVMMGYYNYKKGYRLYSLDRHQFIFSRDVKFFESVFPFKDTGSKEVNTSNAKKESSDEEYSISYSEDEEYVIAVKDFKNFFKKRGILVRQPRNDKKTIHRSRYDKNGSWSDSAEDDDENVKNETCLVAHASSEICLGVDLEPNEWIKDNGCSKHMMGNQKLFSSYKAYNGGNVIFGSNLRGNIIGKGQICDNKCRVTFSEHDTEITKDVKVIDRGYSQNSKAYIILNKHTRKVEESLNMTFDETPPPLVDDDLDEEEAIKVTKKKNLENDIVDETLEIDNIVNIKESRNHTL
nr:RNA-directed DNA polymerase, eukaryota, reverse transcriptase zinc-binding domain protein [Tanacetum cinerariifolium]